MLLFVFFYLFVFTYLFLVLFFDIRKYNSAYLSCAYVPRPIKFTTFINESVGKNKSISSTHGGTLSSKKKTVCVKIYIFFCNYPF